MGKQWLLYKVAGSDAGFPTGKSSSTDKKLAGKSRKRSPDRHTTSSSSSSSFGGCMTAFFHLFDHVQHQHLPFHQPSESSSAKAPDEEPNIILKGVEAPRNSLEETEEQQQEQEPMVEEVASSSTSSSSSKLKQETNFNIPVREIQINTKRSRLTEDISSECSSSPGTKTPTLVARLMGLDLLPENSSPRGSLSSPRVSSSSSHATPLINPFSKLSSHKYNARSLPATPRISTAPRLSTEADYHHRLSLQTNKESNRGNSESTSEYAKQIAKQVRENISRRVGADVTNTVRNKEHRRDEYLVVLKPNRPSPQCTTAKIDTSRTLCYGNGREKENYGPATTVSCAARIRLWEIKNNLKKTNSNSLKSSPLSSASEATKTPSSIAASSSTNPPPLMKEEGVQVVKHVKPLKCKKIASEKYDLRLKNMNQHEELFMKKCNKKSTPLSNHLVKVNTTTKFISFKKDMVSSSSSSTITTTVPQKQVPLTSITQLPSCQSWSYNSKKPHNLSTQYKVSTNGNATTTTTTTTVTTAGSSISDHFDYISSILSHTGVEKTTRITISHWYSPSHPLHPSIFHQIEEKHHHPTATNRADRKLVFEAVDELLVDILKPYISLKPWAQMGQLWAQMGPWKTHYQMCGKELSKLLCDKISCFPASDCQVLEDIDRLIERDMETRTRVVGEVAFEEEAEALVAEMERDMVDTLVGEMAGLILHVGC